MMENNKNNYIEKHFVKQMFLHFVLNNREDADDENFLFLNK